MNNMPDNQREEFARLQRMLEEATAESIHLAPRDVERHVEPSPNDQSHLAERDECVKLREAWLAFGRLLEAAEEAQPAQGQIASNAIEARNASEGIKTQSVSEGIKTRSVSEGIKTRSVSEGIKTRSVSEDAQRASEKSHVESRKKPATVRRYLGAITATAAALCLALGLGWWLTRGGSVRRTDPVTVKQQPVAPREVVTPAPAVVHNDTPSVPNKATVAKQAANAAKSAVWDDTIDTQITAVSQEIESVRQTWQHRVDDVDLVQYRIDEVSAGLANDAL